MKLIAVASEDDSGPRAEVSAHFGRCPYYTLVEVDGKRVISHRVEKNPNFGQHQPGQMPRLIRSLGANAILAGGMGPRAVEMFHGFGIDVATGVAGTVAEAVEAYLQGSLQGVVPCRHDHPESCDGHGAGLIRHQDPPGGGEVQARGEAGHWPVAIPAVDGSGLSAVMDSRFGRAPCFVLVDMEGGEVLEVLINPAVNEVHGAGTAVARIMAQSGVRAVIASRLGPKAVQALRALGIDLWTAPDRITVGAALEKLRAGELSRADREPA